MNFGDIKLVLRSFQGLIPGKSMRRCVIIVLILNESFVAQKWNLARNLALIEWAWALRHLPMSETPAKIDLILARRKWVLCLQMNFDLANGFSQRAPPFSITGGPSQKIKRFFVVEWGNCFTLKLINDV